MAKTGNGGGNAAGANGNAGGGNGPSRTAATVTAIVALVVLLAFITLLWGKADDAGNETAWARWTFLLAGIEAIAFAGCCDAWPSGGPRYGGDQQGVGGDPR